MDLEGIMQEPEKIIANITVINGVTRLTINHEVAKYLDLKPGDKVSGWIRKIDPSEVE